MIRSVAITEPALAMGRAAYRAWIEQQPGGRFERINGIVVMRSGANAMAPERASHNQRKFRIAQLLDAAVRAAGLPCEVFTDGMTVEVGDSDYEPDAVVRCGGKLPDDAIAVPDPLIIVEVLSPSTASIDRALKLTDYFKLPSLRHYLIVWPDTRRIVHHRRAAEGSVETIDVMAGEIRLDPPGVSIAIEAVYAD
jgi:Uma2 family endonuclease